MKTIRLFFILLTLISAGARVLAATDVSDERAEHEKKFLEIIEQQMLEPPEVAIPRLGDIVGKLASDSEPELRESNAYRTAKARLLKVPGHAEYYGREIKRLTEEELAGTINQSVMGRGWYIHILGELQSPETVKVLGELLFDERDMDGDMPTDCPSPPNSLKAAYALHDLGLKTRPVASKYGDAHRDLRAWQLWYEQVRAGNRTFSFVGDDTVYKLDGPVGKTGTPDKPSKLTKAKSPSEKQPGGSAWLRLVIALVLVSFSVFVGMIWWRNR